MPNEQLARFVRCLQGCQVSVALGDGSRIDDCELISAGHYGVQSLWLYVNGVDTFVPFVDVADLWEVVPLPVGPRSR